MSGDELDVGRMEDERNGSCEVEVGGDGDCDVSPGVIRVFTVRSKLSSTFSVLTKEFEEMTDLVRFIAAAASLPFVLLLVSRKPSLSDPLVSHSFLISWRAM